MKIRNLVKILAASAVAIFSVLGAAPNAGAHPMGNFSISHYSRLTASKSGLGVQYVLDMAEIPTVAERAAMDTNGDGRMSSEEQSAYLAARAPVLLQGLHLTIDGRPAGLQIVNSGMLFRPGAGGLDTLRLSMDLKTTAAIPAGAHQIAYQDDNYTERTGWKEIVAAPAAGAYLANASVPATDRTHALTVYPSVTSMSPLQVTSASFTLSDTPIAAAAASSAVGAGLETASATNTSTPQDRFTQAIAAKKLTPGVMLLGLLIAFIFGSFHALSPGHGKTMVAAYLVGSRGTTRHAFLLGLVVTITHTLGVFALGLVTLYASQYIVPEKLFPILSVISGLAVFGVGLWLFYSRIRGLDTHHHHDHDHAHDHDHDHEHSHDHEHTHDHDHSHDHVHAPALALAGASASGHVHDHSHGDHDHTHDYDHMHGDQDHSHDHDHGHTHDHADGGHSHGFGHHHHHHVPDGPITAKSLVALGISGGIVPCPSALVVLLSAIALHRIAYGLLLITAFSVGLASVLIAIGVAVVSASSLLRHAPRSEAFTRFMPILSAAAVTAIGVILVIRAIGGAPI